MTEVISVKFKDNGRSYYFSPDSNRVKVGDKVIVETQNGNGFGIVSEANFEVEEEKIVSPLKKMLRFANEKDIKRLEENKKKENDI